MLLPLLILCVVELATTVPTAADETTPRPGENCGYASCRDASPDVLNVHIVAHTHDDVGWLKTLDQYYYGSQNYIQKACVKCILNSVVNELWEDPKRKFIYAETAYFWKWWVSQPASVRSQVHTLVRQGRLQFVGGAWSMNDEAATHYQSTIDQFTWGLQKLNDTFGECGRPLVGWQIDPFGLSKEFAAELALMGYDGLFLGRIDYQDKAQRLRDKSMEMVWRGSDDLGKSTDIFTSVLYNTYSPPPGFCFDVLCNDEPIIDDINSPMYNVDEKVTDFLNYVLTEAQSYRTNNVLVTMGGDFNFMEAFTWFDNLDRLIKYTNLEAAKQGLKLKVFYSTPACYLKAVKDANPTLPIKQDDFFPYASDPTAYWTGYFTSRPTTKWLEREGNNYLQTFKMLQVLADLPKSNMAVLDELKSAMGVMQHHDAITGTERQHVAHDYERILSRAVDDTVDIASQAFNKLLDSEVNLAFERCLHNQSQCAVTEKSEAFVVTLFSSLGFPAQGPYQMAIFEVVGPNLNYTIYDGKGTKIPHFQMKIPKSILDMPTRRSNATHVIFFFGDVPALGYKTYYVKRSNEKINVNKKIYDHYDSRMERKMDTDWVRAGKTKKPVLNESDPLVVEEPRDIVLENEKIRLAINGTGGMKYFSKSDGTALYLEIESVRYTGCVGNNLVPANRSSGAYIFRPNMTSSSETFGDPVAITDIVQSGPQEVTIHYDNLNLTLSLRDEWLLCLFLASSDAGNELSFRIKTNLKTNGVFYTDSNGRQMVKRIRNKRPQWNVALEEPIPGNYYPVTSEAYIEDDHLRIVANFDRARGVASLKDGQLEFMYYRRLINDDGFGVGEALDENTKGVGLYQTAAIMIQIVPKTKKNLIDSMKTSLGLVHLTRQFQADAKSLTLDKFIKMRTEYSFLKHELPDGLKLLTLEPFKDKILLRLENYLDKDLSPDSIAVDLGNLFTTIEIENVIEMSLAANQMLSEIDRWEWNTEAEFSESFNKEYGNDQYTAKAMDAKKVSDDGLIIKLRAMEIRTFVADYKVLNQVL